MVSTPSEFDTLVLQNMRLAESIAQRYCSARSGRDEDLVQVAYVGLVKAARRFDRSRGIPFAAFARPTISGQLKQHLRDHGWFVRPPRRVQELYHRVADVTPGMTQELGRRPSTADVAACLDATVAAVREAVAWRDRAVPLSLDAYAGADAGVALSDLVRGDDRDLAHAENAIVVERALQRLPARERVVLRLRYFEGLSQQKIADEIGLSQMQVSRILDQSLRVLRDVLADGAPGRVA